jgi:hypothetical protein
MNPFFSKEYYLNKYSDISKSKLSNDPYQHFILNGHLENREPCNLNELNWQIYKNFNNFNNLNNLNNLENLDIKYLKEHFIKFGLLNYFNITKINSKLDNILINKYQNIGIYFDFQYYIKNNKDLLHINNINDAIQHYIYHGFKEKRMICNVSLDKLNKYIYETSIENNYNSYFSNNNNNNNNIELKKKFKTLVIYCYYNRPGEYKNELNLILFINETIKKCKNDKKFKNDFNQIEFLFIINGNFTEVEFPKYDNIKVLKNKNCYDFESYLIGIKYIEKQYNNDINNLFNYVLFMNCSITGPFNNSNTFWLDPFYKTIENNIDNIECGLVTPILTFLPSNYGVVQGPQIPGYFFMVKTKFINLLIKSHNHLNKNYSNTILGIKKNKYDCILSGEHMLSVIMLKNNINILGIVNPLLNYINKKNWIHLIFNSDRHPNHNINLEKCIFIKNNWRINENERDCHPVQWSKTFNEIKKRLNITEIIDTSLKVNNKFLFNLLNINNNGIVRFNNDKWNSKEHFYKIFGESEQFLLFPNSKCIKTINYFYFNNNNNNTNFIPKYTIEGLISLLYLDYKILIFSDSINYIKSLFKKTFGLYHLINNSIYFFEYDVNYEDLQHDINLGCKMLKGKLINSNLIFPCCEIKEFEYELDNNKIKILKENNKNIFSIDNIKNKNNINNCYLNYLTMFNIL